MILSFSQQINGQPTYFVEKIWSGLKHLEVCPELANYLHSDYATGKSILDLKPKLHSMREDKSNRWKVGMDIHMVINNRTKNRLQFAPVVKVEAIQKVEIRHSLGYVLVLIDDEEYEAYHNGLDDIYEWSDTLLELAHNDGFEDLESFFAYFNEDFSGKLIHWADKRYTYE